MKVMVDEDAHITSQKQKKVLYIIFYNTKGVLEKNHHTRESGKRITGSYYSDSVLFEVTRQRPDHRQE